MESDSSDVDGRWNQAWMNQSKVEMESSESQKASKLGIGRIIHDFFDASSVSDDDADLKSLDSKEKNIPKIMLSRSSQDNTSNPRLLFEASNSGDRSDVTYTDVFEDAFSRANKSGSAIGARMASSILGGVLGIGIGTRVECASGKDKCQVNLELQPLGDRPSHEERQQGELGEAQGQEGSSCWETGSPVGSDGCKYIPEMRYPNSNSTGVHTKVRIRHQALTTSFLQSLFWIISYSFNHIIQKLHNMNWRVGSYIN